MAVQMSGEFVLPADKATVWAALNDAETLKASIPGCESLEKLSDTELQAAVKVKIGPVSARFKGKVNLTDIDAPNSYRISGQGDGGYCRLRQGRRRRQARGRGRRRARGSPTTSTPRSAARSPSSAAASSTRPPRNSPTSSSPTSPRRWAGRRDARLYRTNPSMRGTASTLRNESRRAAGNDDGREEWQ